MPTPPTIDTLMRAAGYEPHHTGGNLWVWRKPVPTDATALIVSNDSNLDGDPAEPVWSVGRYSTTDEMGCIDLEGTYTLAQALKLAPLLPSPINPDGTEDQRLLHLPDLGPAAVLTAEPVSSINPITSATREQQIAHAWLQSTSGRPDGDEPLVDWLARLLTFAQSEDRSAPATETIRLSVTAPSAPSRLTPKQLGINKAVLYKNVRIYIREAKLPFGGRLTDTYTDASLDAVADHIAGELATNDWFEETD